MRMNSAQSDKAFAKFTLRSQKAKSKQTDDASTLAKRPFSSLTKLKQKPFLSLLNKETRTLQKGYCQILPFVDYFYLSWSSNLVYLLLNTFN